MPCLGISIVHYYAEELLAQCLSRLQASDITDYQVCIVDCGSRDGLDRLVQMDERFHLLSPERNIGFAAGTNLAFEKFPDEIRLLLSLNPDVLVEPDTISRVCQQLEADPQLGAITCKLILPSRTLDPACRRSAPTIFTSLSKQLGLQRLFPRSRFFGKYNLTYLDSTRPHEIDSGTGAFLLLRREALRAAGGKLDERFFLYGEDLDLCLRIRQAGYRIRYTPDTWAMHVKGSGRIRSFPTTLQFYKAMWIYYRKWGRYRSNPLVLSLLGMALILLGTSEGLCNSIRKLIQKQRSRY